MIKFKNDKLNTNKMTYEEKLLLVPIYGNVILEEDMVWCCGNCKHYDFGSDSMQICNNENNHQMLKEGKWFKMMVTPAFCCNEWDN